MNPEPIVVMCAVGGRDEAAAIARMLVENRLAACVQAMPIESWYRWDGAVQNDSEVMLHIKTVKSRFAAMCEAIGALHSYDVPEILALRVTDVSPRYLDWMRDAVG